MIRFYNGRVLSFAGEKVIISDNEVWTDGGSICYVGPARADMPAFEREEDLHGDLLMPGFKNAHTHTAMTFLRSYADDLPLDKWLSEQVWPAEAKLSGDAVRACTMLGIMEYLSGGITSSFDMYINNESFAKANVDAGFRTVLCSGFNNFDRDIDKLEREFLRFNSYHELVSFRMGLHAEYTTCMERMEHVARLVDKYKVPCYSHLCETKNEVAGCVERYGVTPPVLFERLGMYEYGGGGFHCCYMSDEDVEIFRKHGLWVITNPASNLKLASGIAPIVRFQQAGIGLAIGTDGAASNNALDMFREMYLVAVLQKYLLEDAAACDADSVLRMACCGGARAMGLPECDNIEVGKKADLIVIDLHQPNMQPINSLSKNLVYAGSRQNVRLTMVNGRILYENGEFFIGEAPEDIYSEVGAFVRSIRG